MAGIFSLSLNMKETKSSLQSRLSSNSSSQDDQTASESDTQPSQVQMKLSLHFHVLPSGSPIFLPRSCFFFKILSVAAGSSALIRTASAFLFLEDKRLRRDRSDGPVGRTTRWLKTIRYVLLAGTNSSSL